MNQRPWNKVFNSSEIGPYGKGLTPAFTQPLRPNVKVYYFH